MSAKAKGRYFSKRKRIKKHLQVKPRVVYTPTPDDFEIATNFWSNVKRFEEILTLNSLELAKAILSNPEITFTSRHKVLVNISNMQEPDVSIFEKCRILKEQITAKSYSSSELTAIKNLFSNIKAQQTEIANQKLRKAIVKMKSKFDNAQRQNMRKSENHIAILRSSQIWDAEIRNFGDTELFWEILTYLHFSNLDVKSSKFFEEDNRKLIDSLSRVIHFLPMEELNSRLKIDQSVNPIFYAGILLARIYHRNSKKLLEQFLEFLLKNEESINISLGEATRVNQTKARAKKIRAQEASELAEAARLELENRIIQCRASGAVNAHPEFDLFLRDLKKIDGREWNLDLLSEFLMQDYTDSNIDSGILAFLIKNFEYLDHPVSTFMTSGATIWFETTDKQFLLYKFKVAYFGNYDLIFKKFDSLNELRKAENDGFLYGGQSLPNMSYTTASGIRRLMYEHFTSLKVSVVKANFTRRKTEIDLLDLVAFVYRDANIGELIPHYFANWQFFTDGYPCDGCGRPLTHQVSAVKGKGPVCGDHNYALGQSDASRVEKVISRVRKDRLFANHSPLIRQRVETFVWNPVTGEALLKRIANSPNLSHAQALSDIERRIRGRFRPPRIAWGSSRSSRSY